MRDRRGGSSSLSSSSSVFGGCSPVRCFFILILSTLMLLLFLVTMPLLEHPTDLEKQFTSEKEHLQKLIENQFNNLRHPVLEHNNPSVPNDLINGNLQQNSNQQIDFSKTVSPKMPLKIAYAITVTKDGPFVDGALVLGFAAHKFHSAKLGFPSAYEVELVAFVTKTVHTSRDILSKFGWRIVERDLPVQLDEIENKEYVSRMKDSGCCGADEFLKLWAFTLTEYHRVIHLDMDSIVFKNMDEIFNLNYDLLFTGDYNMMAGSPVPPAQGGFLVVRPSMDTFKAFQNVIRKGDHRPGSGWGGSKIGNFWGGQTIQGIVPYFYHVLQPGKAKELNRCQYNSMVDNPYNAHTMKCLNKQPTCEDCRLTEFSKVSSAHFTICQKPWTCTYHANPRNKVLCEQYHKRWFELRDEYERNVLHISPESYRAEKTRFVDSKGMCKGYGDDKYIPIPVNQVQGIDNIF